MTIFQKLLKHALPALVRYTGVTQVVTATDHGTFAFLPGDKFIGWKMAVQRTRDPAMTRLIEDRVRPGDLVIDAGANLGWYSVVLARRVGAHGGVLAFEPEPRAFALLIENLRANGVAAQVRAFNLALAAASTGLTLELSDNNFGDHRIRTGAAGVADRYRESAREIRPVRAARLDDVLQQSGFDTRAVAFIKIDCQGYEVEILRGARATLARTACVLLEYWPYALRRCGAGLDDLIAALDPGFTHFARVEDGRAALDHRPMVEFRDDATRVRTAMDYLFSRQ